MIPIAHFIAISCYIGAAALAALPFARGVRAPVGSVPVGSRESVSAGTSEGES